MKKPFVLLSSLLIAGSLIAADLDPATLSEAEWTEYRFERLMVVRANPDLAAAADALKADTKSQAQAVEAAMVKADPSVAPLLTKLAALLNGNWYAPAEGDVLSFADWQKIRAARAAALQANPDLVSSQKALKDKKEALDAKVDATLVKADPSLAGLVGKLNERDAD
jgi:2-oxo-4-hydroxy-4-carboxy--5-ureidoimidazoline (OHCU) decarboxylase